MVNFTEEAEYKLKDAIVKDALFEILNMEDEEGVHVDVRTEIRHAAEVLLKRWFMSKQEWDMMDG